MKKDFTYTKEDVNVLAEALKEAFKVVDKRSIYWINYRPITKK